MKIQKLGHSCLLVEQDDAKLLIDPGIFTSDFTTITGLTGVLVPPPPADHVNPQQLATLVGNNPDLPVYTDEATVEQLADAGVTATAVHEGDTLDLGTSVRAFGQQHAVIHPDVPRIPNVCFLIADKLFHPGDSLTVPDAKVDILALPVAAPWLKSWEAVDYLRAVQPRLALPIHEAVLIKQALPLYYGLFERLAPEGTQWTSLDNGEPADL
jgi:L-ascorbate metabolism protein UlaG (beta-lactamase superfamily)